MALAERIRTFSKDNIWIIAAVLFFVAWKFFLIGTLWEERLTPPIPSDSSVYLLHIDATLNCSNSLSCADRAISFNTYTGVDHLSYRLFLGLFGKIFGLDAVETYEFGFYIGTVLLALALALFMSRIAGNDKKLAAFLIIILGLYNGSGSYHGFFWVVPSFFSLLLFFLILNVILDRENQHWKIWLAILGPLSIFTHMLGLYMLFVLPIYFIFSAFLSKSFDILLFKKIAYVIAICTIVYIPVSIYFTLNSYGNPYGPESFATRLIERAELSADQNNLQKAGLQGISPPAIDLLGWGNIYADYFRWIFPSWIGYLAFFTCLALHFYFKQYRILCLYLSGLFFTLISSINPHGERSLIFLWPMTYLLYGHSSWLAVKFLHTKVESSVLRSVLKATIIVATLFSAMLSLSYSYYWNVYLNHLTNISVTSDLKDFLVNNTRPDETVFYSTEADFIDNLLMLESGDEKPVKALSSETARWHVSIDSAVSERDSLFYKYVFDQFFKVISTTLTFEKKFGNHAIPLEESSLEKPSEPVRFDSVLVRSNR